MKAIVLLKLASLEVQEAYARLKRIEAVTDAYAVYGRYDAVAFIQAADLEEIRRILLTQVHCLPGVIEVLPCVMVENERPAPTAELPFGSMQPPGKSPENPSSR